MRIIITKLWINRIKNEKTLKSAKEMYSKVPRLLKEKVKEGLIKEGYLTIVDV